MKKILISVLIVLLVILAYFAAFKGISLGNFKILSVKQIANENEKLTQEITQTELLINNEYPSKTNELDKTIANLLTAEEEYLDLAKVSTEGELQQANQEEEYTVEFLLTRFGRYATKEGVNLVYTLSQGSTGNQNMKNISFTVTGGYIPIINFITNIEDDSKLGFRIQSFKMTPDGDNRKATFLVTNVKVKQEKTTVAPTTPNTTQKENNTTTGSAQNTTNNTQSTTNQNTTANTNNQGAAANNNVAGQTAQSTQSNTTNNT